MFCFQSPATLRKLVEHQHFGGTNFCAAHHLQSTCNQNLLSPPYCRTQLRYEIQVNQNPCYLSTTAYKATYRRPRINLNITLKTLEQPRKATGERSPAVPPSETPFRPPPAPLLAPPGPGGGGRSSGTH